ncbi:MAG: hypothetical protein H6607_06240 [Flavobacteriales bacterium]|nr:hypothetical protein [Flavobacteriales bacterium]
MLISTKGDAAASRCMTDFPFCPSSYLKTNSVAIASCLQSTYQTEKRIFAGKSVRVGL